MTGGKLSWKGGGGGERRAHSFLVRLWLEPREEAGESMAIRGYFRNLRTGEEHFVTDPKAIVEMLERSVEGEEESEETLRKPGRRSHDLPRPG